MCVLEFKQHVCTNEFFSWTWQALARIIVGVGVRSDSVSPLGVIPGDIAKESSLYSRPAEPPPALNKDTQTRKHTHTCTVFVFFAAPVHGGGKPVHRGELRGNSSSLSKSSNLKEYGETLGLALNVPAAEGTGDKNPHSYSLFSPPHADTHMQFHPSKIQHTLSVMEYFSEVGGGEGEKGFQVS